MSKYKALASGDVFPAYWTDAIQEFTGSWVAGLRLTTPSASVVRVVAGSGSDQVAIGVDGLYRYRTSLQEVTISGSTGTYNLYAAVSANSIAGITDSTDYNWYLYFGTSAPSGAIAGAGTIGATRKIGEVDWDSSAGAITGLRQLTGSGDVTLPLNPTAPLLSVTPLTVRGVASQSANLLSIGSNTSPTNRLTLTAGGQLALPVTGSNGGIVIGADTSIIRSSSATLTLTGSLIISSGLTTNGDTVLSTGGGNLAFYGGSATTKKTGYGSGSMVGSKAALTASSSTNDVIAVVSSLVADLRAYGLIGA
jgi:hypothetical protein